MFVADIPATECTTTEGEDVEFPDPGSSTETAQTANPGKPTGPQCGAAGGASYNTSASASPTHTEAPSYDTASSASGSALQSQTLGPVYGVAKGSNGTVTATTLATITASGILNEPTAIPPSPPSYSQSSQASEFNGTTSLGGCTSGSVKCTSPGSVVCIGSSQWGLCDIDNCAIPRELSAGTSCSADAVSKRHISRHIGKHLHHARSLEQKR